MVKEVLKDGKIHIKAICPYCGTAFNNVATYYHLCSDVTGEHGVINVYCSDCEKPIIFLKSSLSLKANYSQLNKDFIKAVENFYEKKIYRRGGFVFVDYEKYKQIKPEFNYRGSIPKEVVDSDIVRDYMEACLVLGISTRASSALSRRCLQNIIEKNTNIKSVNLNKQIDSLIESQNLPSSITDLLHAAREIGNISVHPIKDLKSNEIIETDIEEAELILDIIESLFDYYYVMPAKNSERKNRLNKKLSDAGRDTV